jgi:propanol-preferring alcohol dehydrogenase
MSDIPSFPYELLWRERVLRSVANLTRADGIELLALAAEIPLRTDTVRFPLERAEEAVAAARGGDARTPVLVPS